MFFTDRESYGNGVVLGDCVRETRITRQRLDSARLAESRVLHASSGIRTTIAGEGWAAVGDSAASYDPLSGFGVVKALHHGVIAADAAHAALEGGATAFQPYAVRVRGEFAEYTRRRAIFYDAERRKQGGPFWQRRTRGRVGSIP